MSSLPWRRVLYPGLLLFGVSLSLSKSASTALLVGLYLSAFVAAWRDREFRDDVLRSRRQPLTAALAFFSLVAYVGILYTEKYADGFNVANKFVELPVIYLFVSAFLQSVRSEEERTRQAESLLLSFIVGLTALNLFGLMTFFGAFGGVRYALPLTPLGLHHIWFSNINALGLYAGASFLLFSPRGRSLRARVLLGSFLLVSVLCILLSTSRTAWFSIATTLAIMAAATIRSKKTVALVALLSILTLAAVYRFVPLVHDRINLVVEELTTYSTDRYAESSTGGRLLMWRATLIMIKAHPLIGVGTGDFPYTLNVMRKQLRTRVVPRFLLGFNQPHNMYLFAMATNGVAGLTALLYIFYRCLRPAAPVVRAGGAGRFFAFLAMATAVHFMVAGFLDSFFNIQVLRYCFAFIMGVCIRNSAPCERRS